MLKVIQLKLGVLLIAFTLFLLWLHVAAPVANGLGDWVAMTPFALTGAASIWSALTRD